jgi:hypothetical protein
VLHNIYSDAWRRHGQTMSQQLDRVLLSHPNSVLEFESDSESFFLALSTDSAVDAFLRHRN